MDESASPFEAPHGMFTSKHAGFDANGNWRRTEDPTWEALAIRPAAGVSSDALVALHDAWVVMTTTPREAPAARSATAWAR